ncbi:MAG: acyl carrier protein [Alphaproteobacteria bacterium]
MDKAEFFLALDELLELKPGTITGPEKLSSFDNWDSLAVISLIALADEKFNIVLGSDAIAEAQTFDELLTIVSQNNAD